MLSLVISIPEEDFEIIKHNVAVDKCPLRQEEIVAIIANGTPLPKEHGRLIDADALKKDDELAVWLSLNPVRTGKMLKYFSEIFIKKIDAALTIIEAESEI